MTRHFRKTCSAGRAPHESWVVSTRRVCAFQSRRYRARRARCCWPNWAVRLCPRRAFSCGSRATGARSSTSPRVLLQHGRVKNTCVVKRWTEGPELTVADMYAVAEDTIKAMHASVGIPRTCAAPPNRRCPSWASQHCWCWQTGMHARDLPRQGRPNAMRGATGCSSSWTNWVGCGRWASSAATWCPRRRCGRSWRRRRSRFG